MIYAYINILNNITKVKNVLDSISDNIPFNYFEKYDDLFNRIPPTDLQSIFIIVDKVQLVDRIFIKRLQHLNPKCGIFLFSNISYAMDAWNLRVSYFNCFPLDKSKIQKAISEHTTNLDDTNSSLLPFKTKNGMLNVEIKSLNFIKADGNYSEFHISNERKIVQTSQINKYEYLTYENSELRKVHRSLILNMSNIQKIQNEDIYFYNSKPYLRVSKNLIRKIKRILLGYEI